MSLNLDFISVFGIGSMIYSGIEVGMFVEQNWGENSDCNNVFSVLRPVLQMFFVFVQMYFIFLNQKMNIYKSKFVSRFGLMHMIATNLCIWFNVLILETSHEIMEGRHASTHNHRWEMIHAVCVVWDDIKIQEILWDS